MSGRMPRLQSRTIKQEDLLAGRPEFSDCQDTRKMSSSPNQALNLPTLEAGRVTKSPAQTSLLVEAGRLAAVVAIGLTASRGNPQSMEPGLPQPGLEAGLLGEGAWGPAEGARREAGRVRGDRHATPACRASSELDDRNDGTQHQPCIRPMGEVNQRSVHWRVAHIQGSQELTVSIYNVRCLTTGIGAHHKQHRANAPVLVALPGDELATARMRCLDDGKWRLGRIPTGHGSTRDAHAPAVGDWMRRILRAHCPACVEQCNWIPLHGLQ